MADQEFKPGDVVQLKSGGPKMTVQEAYEEHGDNKVICNWFTRDNEPWVKASDRFLAAQLKIVTP